MNALEDRMGDELAWAHEHDGDPATWAETCRAIEPRSGAMCDLRRGHVAGHYQVSDWLGRYGTAW